MTWMPHLNDVRRRAVRELDQRGRLTDDIIDALRDEKYHHAAGLVLAAVTEHQHDAARIARALETGESQE